MILHKRKTNFFLNIKQNILYFAFKYVKSHTEILFFLQSLNIESYRVLSNVLFNNVDLFSLLLSV
jgi:hypothetical protein